MSGGSLECAESDDRHTVMREHSRGAGSEGVLIKRTVS